MTNHRQMFNYVMKRIQKRHITAQNIIMDSRFQQWRNYSKYKIKKSKDRDKLATITFRLKKFFNGKLFISTSH